MAGLFRDSVTMYSSGTILQRYSTNTSGWQVGAQTGFTGNVVHGNIGELGLNLPVECTSLYIGARVLIDSFSPGPNFSQVFNVYDTYGNRQAILSISPQGALSYSVTAGQFEYITPIVLTKPDVIRPGTINFIELGIIFSATNGTVSARVNNVQVLSRSGIPTMRTDVAAVTGIRAVALKAGQNVSHYFRDIYINDGTGATNNGFKGDGAARAYFPAANGQQNDWTASSGANFAAVNSPVPDGDTTYVSSDTPGQKELYTLDQMSSTILNLSDVQPVLNLRKEGSSGRTYRILASHGTTINEGVVSAAADSYHQNWIVWETDPVSGVAWTRTLFNTLQIGVKEES